MGSLTSDVVFHWAPLASVKGLHYGLAALSKLNSGDLFLSLE